MKKLTLSKVVESKGILTGGFTTLTPKQQAKLKGGADNCDCTNKKNCKVKEAD
ncbi:hypothetical protein [[Flexibacter] sp. ATCC 35103]|uniref:hypothetical protein n=1 Tax=[Flexibacter] sp. ATCC 35103 TaxID=1937528 RepID=UPI0013F68DB5|nr:hypothetical protein [[Flexibacter] sp. ATCC 35103]